MSETEEKVAAAVEKKLDFKNYLNAYEFDTTLPGSKEVVTFKPMTTGQLKQLLVYEDETNPMVMEKALDGLITSSVISQDFNINNLFLEDRFFLLIEIRKKSKGNSYQFQYNCKTCGSQTPQNIILDELDVKVIPEGVEDVVSIDNNLSVRLSHVTRGGQKEAFGSIKNVKKMSDIQRMTEMSILTHAASIRGIIIPDGEIMDSSIEDRKYLLENIPTKGYAKIRDWFENNDFGVDFNYTIKCGQCGYEERIDIPVDNFFF